MPVFNPQKKVSPSVLDCQGTAEVTLCFDASGEMAAEDTLVVLLLDRSGSMGGQRMEYMKRDAADLVRAVALASGGTAEGSMGGKTTAALCSFGDTAVINRWPTGDVGQLLAGIDTIRATGLTNHAEAFKVASYLLSGYERMARKVVLFTDGKTTAGGDAQPFADQLKKSGAEIFCIGLLNNPDAIRGWASLPSFTHVSYTNDLTQLSRVFAEITAEVVEAGARDVVIREEVNPDFQIRRVLRLTDGTAEITGGSTLIWRMDGVGLEAGKTTASLTFELGHVGKTGGVKEVSRSLTYRDRAGHRLTFPNPAVTVHCPQPGPEPVALSIPGCHDAVQLRVECVVDPGPEGGAEAPTRGR